MEVREVFNDLIGQEPAKRLLQGTLANDKLAQTMIFAGPSGVGRKTAAMLLAKALHGERSAHHPDTFVFSNILEEMRANKKGIKDAVDELVRFMGLSPISSKYKVAVIDDAGAISLAGQNALLKTLEEPRADTVLILIVEDERQLLPTITSRSQVVRFYPLKESEIRSEEAEVPMEILKAAQGSLGFAKRMLVDPVAWESIKEMNDFWMDLDKKDTEARFGWADKMKERSDALWFLQTGARVLRRQLVGQPDVTKAKQLARIQETIYMVQENVNARAAVEVLLLAI